MNIDIATDNDIFAISAKTFIWSSRRYWTFLNFCRNQVFTGEFKLGQSHFTDRVKLTSSIRNFEVKIMFSFASSLARQATVGAFSVALRESEDDTICRHGGFS